MPRKPSTPPAVSAAVQLEGHKKQRTPQDEGPVPPHRYGLLGFPQLLILDSPPFPFFFFFAPVHGLGSSPWRRQCRLKTEIDRSTQGWDVAAP